jgi:hypothetical protein
MAGTLLLKYAVVIPTKCDTQCQSNLNTHLGQVNFNAINQAFKTTVTAGYFGLTLKQEGEASGLFKDGISPMASAADLSYRFAVKSEGLTWTPTLSPTNSPIIPPSKSPSEAPSPFPTASSSPTGSTYYPDYVNHVCKNDDGYGEWEINFFKSLEECCSFPWIDHDTCMEYSFTTKPTQKPSRKPSRQPSNHPTPQPTKKNQTPKPTEKVVSNSAGAGEVYYPDLALGVCKSDGNHGNIPYQFSNPEDCCTNNYMDYNECMAYANPTQYYPDIYEGNCRVVDGSEGTLMYIFDSAEKCCSNGWMVYDECMASTLGSGATPEPTHSPSNAPSRKPVGRSPPGNYYPLFSEGYCKSDGQHANSAYVFTSAEKCCTNAVMDYDECFSLTMAALPPSDITCITGMWHADPNNFGACTNAPTGYPESWNEPASRDDYLFTTHSKCCTEVFLNANCVKNDVCDVNGSTPVVTSSPPTRSPSRQPSASPMTEYPTYSPTTSYTIPPVVLSAIDARHATSEILDSFENGLTGAFPWSTTPDKPWTIDNSIAVDGSSSAVSSPITKGETSDLYVAVNSQHGGAFFFFFKSDVQMPYSGCYINIDGVSDRGYTYPTKDWMDLTMPIEPGQHVIMFRTWAPTVSLPGGSPVSNTIHVDKVSFQPTLFEDYESKSLAWNTIKMTGKEWAFDETKAHGGNVSLRSPSGLNVGQSSKMSFELTTSRRGSVLSFHYNSDGWVPSDKFMFKIDGNIVLEVTKSSRGWEQETAIISPGMHILSWEFVRAGNEGGGAVWLDDMKIVPRT